MIITMLGLLAASSQPLQPSKADVQEALGEQDYAPYTDGGVGILRNEVRLSLRTHSPDVAADSIAAKHGIASADMRRLVRAWVIAQSHRYGGGEDWKSAVREELLALAPRLRGNPLALSLLAETLDMTTENCTAQDFEALIQGSADPAADGHRIAVSATCSANFVRAAAVAGDRAMPALIRAAEYGGLPPRDVLPIYAWLTSPATLGHIREQDRAAVSAVLWQRYLKALFDAGLHGQALALFDALPSDLRAAVVSPEGSSRRNAVIDDIAMTFDGEGRQSEKLAEDLAEAADALEAGTAKKRFTAAKSVPTKEKPRDLSSIDAPILRLAEAMALAGRHDEARRMLATLPGLAEARAAGACVYRSAGQPKVRCGDLDKLPMGALPVDHLLNTPEADPYPIAETTLSGSNFGISASNAVLCRLFPKEVYPDLCVAGPDNVYFSDVSPPLQDVAGTEAALERAIPNLRALRTSILGAYDVPGDAKPSLHVRRTVAAVAPDFEERAIPLEYLGEAPPSDTKGFAALPNGFLPVRMERAGKRAVAVSVSQTYDPTGEISQGGYWVHLSDDGGKHWERPLYTGLAQRFPYVVTEASRLPLIDGDTLRLAVNIAEIDTATITYPPVGLRSRRVAKDRYLTIPIERLRRDSNGDGVTDIVADHLLLDRVKSGRGTPFVVGSDTDARCERLRSAEKLAVIELLGRITGDSEAAIVEPIDRQPGEFATGWLRATAAAEQPVFLLGAPQDFTCLSARRPIIVYSKADIEALQAFTPAFHTLEIPKIIFNRAHDRGYVRWSTGWAGGTYRLRLIGGKWEFDSISNWIT